jgi:hypothetical protein
MCETLQARAATPDGVRFPSLTEAAKAAAPPHVTTMHGMEGRIGQAPPAEPPLSSSAMAAVPFALNERAGEVLVDIAESPSRSFCLRPKSLVASLSWSCPRSS